MTSTTILHVSRCTSLFQIAARMLSRPWENLRLLRLRLFITALYLGQFEYMLKISSYVNAICISATPLSWGRFSEMMRKDLLSRTSASRFRTMLRKHRTDFRNRSGCGASWFCTLCAAHAANCGSESLKPTLLWSPQISFPQLSASLYASFLGW